MRKQIEDGLRINAYDIYGLSEVMGPMRSAECQYKCGMHICEDHFIAEVIDPDTLGGITCRSAGASLYFTCQRRHCSYQIQDKRYSSLIYDMWSAEGTHVRMLKPRAEQTICLSSEVLMYSRHRLNQRSLSVDEKATNYMLVVDRVNNLDTLKFSLKHVRICSATV